jgi:rhamnose utilization protein RhaD (predicted bifunctional aldolase and dehydrogenase)
VLAAMNVENIDAVHAEVYGDVAPLVPYHCSGHALARACMEIFSTHRTPRTIGLILAFHGVVAFGDDARSSYENMIRLVTMAEHYLKARNAWELPTTDTTATALDTTALARVHAEINGVAGHEFAMHVVSDMQYRVFARRADLTEISQQGPATPQHAVFTKRVPMLGRDVHSYAKNYRNYLDTHVGRSASKLIDAAPRVMLDPEFGLVAFGKDERTAQIAAEMYCHDIGVITRASAHGTYRSAPPEAIAQAEFEYGGYAQRQREAAA